MMKGAPKHLKGVPTAPDPEAMQAQADSSLDPLSALPGPGAPPPEMMGPPEPEVQGPPPPDPSATMDALPGPSHLEELYSSVAQTDPDRAAKVLAISKRISEPESFVDKNLEHIERVQNQPPTSLWTQIEKQYPGTTKFLGAPRNMAVAHDDVENVANHEKLTQDVAVAQGWVDAWRAGYQANSIPGIVSTHGHPNVVLPQDPSIAQSILAQGGALIGGGDLVAMGLAGFGSSVVGASAGAIGMGAAGSVVPGAGTIAGLATGVTVGGAVAGAYGAWAVPAAIKDALREAYQRDDIKTASDLLHLSWSHILKDANKQGVVGLLTGGAGGFASKLGAGPITKLGVEAATMETAGAAIEGKAPTARGLVESALLMGGLHAGTHGVVKAVNLIADAKKAQVAKNFYTALGDTAEASKLRERMPEAHQKLVHSITVDGPVENVYIPVQAATEYFQSKNIAPESVMDELGVRKSFDEAKETGGSVAIPLSTWVNKVVGTEHYKALANDVKFHPDDMTFREVENHHREIEEQLKQVEAEAQKQAQEIKAQQAEQEKQGSSQKIYDTIQEQLKKAGLSAEEAKLDPKIHEAFFTTLGKHLGVDPAELFARFPLKIGTGEGTGERVYEQTQGKRGLDHLKEKWDAKQAEQKLQDFAVDPVTGTLNARAFEELAKNPEKPMVGHISVEGVKHVNDREGYGHEAADALYRHVGQALMEQNPDVAKVGGDFAVHVKDQAELDQLLAKAHESLPDVLDLNGKPVSKEGFKLTGKAGASLEEASKSHIAYKQGLEALGERASRGAEPKGFRERAGEKGQAPKSAVAQIHPKVGEAFKSLSDEEAFKKIHQTETGLLTYDAFKQLPEAKFQGSLDLNGIKEINDKFGYEQGNDVLAEFETVVKLVAQEMGFEPDVAHKSGDEYLTQHDDGEKLSAFWLAVRDKIGTLKHEGFNKDGEPEIVPLTISVGLDRTKENAEHRLQEAKQESKAGAGNLLERRSSIRTWVDAGAEAGGNEEGSGSGQTFHQSGLPGSERSNRSNGSDQSESSSQDSQSKLAPPFYSKLTKTVEEKMGASASVQQINGMLKEIKPEERKWLGVDDFLKGKEKVSKEEFLDFLRGNALQIKEIQTGYGMPADKAYLDWVTKKYGDRWLDMSDDQIEATKEEFRAERGGGTKFSQYTLPGGENYREVLFTLPPKLPEGYRMEPSGSRPGFVKLFDDKGLMLGEWPSEESALKSQRKVGENYHSSHFDEPNVLAHTRLNDRTDSEGKKVLFVEEIQSDWHQAGRKKGYGDAFQKPEKTLSEEEIKRTRESFSEKLAPIEQEVQQYSSEKREALYQQMRDNPPELMRMIGTIAPAIQEGYNRGVITLDDLKAMEAANAQSYRQPVRTGHVPDAPFKKTWHEFVLKRLIREASEKGYDKVAWTTGEQQAERYDLSKQISEVQYKKLDSGLYSVAVMDKAGEEVYKSRSISDADLEDKIGKELTAKIVAGEGKGYRGRDHKSLEGLDLKVGGEGMKGFYDKILVDFANKFGKKFGAKVGESALPDASEGSAAYKIDNEEGWRVLSSDGETVIADNLESRKIAEKILKKKLGENAPSLKVHSLEITPELKKAALEEGFSLFQPGDENGPRGRITIGPTQFNIDLLKSADRSTFLHETGHYFLEVLGNVASDPNAPEQVKQDYQTLLKWLGVESKDKIAVEHHEQFARGFEAYLMEGKAPSSALAKAFDRFKNWLTSIYREMKNLKVDLTDDVRGVMDRMLASQDEIASAQKEMGLDSAPMEGVPPELQGRIRELQEKARAIAEKQLLTEQMKELKDDHKKFLAAEKERITNETKADVQKMPLFSAVEDLRSQEHEKDPVRRALDYLKATENGGEPDPEFDVQAEIHGFSSGENLAQQIVMARDLNTFKTEVDARVKLGMAKYADMKDTDKIKALALHAVHNEKQLELMALEKEAMEGLIKQTLENDEVSKRKRSQAALTAKIIRVQAQTLMAEKSLKDATNPRVYFTAEKNAAVRVAKALAKKDYEKASEAKSQQMLNHALASEAMKNRDTSEKALNDLGKYASRGNDLMKSPYGFVRQVDQLLSRFGMAEDRPQDLKTFTEIARQMAQKGEEPDEIANRTGLKEGPGGQWIPETLPDFVNRLNESYYTLILPDSVLSGSRRSPREMTLGELKDLHEAVTQIVDVGRKHDKFLKEMGGLDVKAAATMFRGAVEKNIGTPYAEEKGIGSSNKSRIDKAISAITSLPDSLIPSMVNMATLAKYLDGGKNDGLFHQMVYRPLKEAEDRKFARYQKMTKEIEDLFSKFYSPKELASYKDKKNEVYFPGLDRKLTREQILSVALNWGNEGNRDRIKRGFNLEEPQIQQILSHLAKKDWDFVQAVWDHLDSYWPEITALEMRVNGVEPKRVDTVPVETPHGQYRGGYYPIVYDYEKSSEAYKNAEQKNELYKQFSAAAAHTDRGHTKERVAAVTRPVRLSLDVLFNHLDNVVHDLEFREPIIDVNRFLKQRDTRTALENSIGVKGAKSIGDWLKAQGADQSENLNFADKAFQWTRFSTTLSTLGFTPKAFLLHLPSNVFNSAWEIGFGRTAKMLTSSFMDHVTGKGDLKDFVFEKSERMKQRLTVRDRDIMDMSRKWQGEGGIKGALPHYAFMAIHFADEAVSIPLWAEVYRSHVADLGEAKAKALADEAVTRTLGSGSMVDRIGAQRGGGLKKLYTMFYSWMSVMFNRAWLDGKIAGLEYSKGNVGAAASIIAKATFFAWLLPAAHEALLAEAMRNAPDDGDEERAKRILGKLIEHPFAYMLIARDVAPPLIHTALGEKGLDHYQMSPIEQAFQNLIMPAGHAIHIALSEKEADEKFAEEMARAAAQLAGTPQQVNAWAFNLLDYMQDNGEATWKDFLSRRRKK
jgi:GGDEF domain-containing protein